MIQELHDTFLALCQGLDEDYLEGHLELRAGGYGEFLLMEQRTHEQMTEDKYPAWAKKQRLQAKWFTLEDGVGMLNELLRVKLGVTK